MVDMELVGHEILIFVVLEAVYWLDIRGYTTIDIELFGLIGVDLYSGVLVTCQQRYFRYLVSEP